MKNFKYEANNETVNEEEIQAQFQFVSVQLQDS